MQQYLFYNSLVSKTCETQLANLLPQVLNDDYLGDGPNCYAIITIIQPKETEQWNRKWRKRERVSVFPLTD